MSYNLSFNTLNVIIFFAANVMSDTLPAGRIHTKWSVLDVSFGGAVYCAPLPRGGEVDGGAPHCAGFYK